MSTYAPRSRFCSEGAYAQSLIARPNSSLGVGGRKKGKKRRVQNRFGGTEAKEKLLKVRYAPSVCTPPSSICAGTDVSADRSLFSFRWEVRRIFFWAGCDKKRKKLMEVRSG